MKRAAASGYHSQQGVNIEPQHQDPRNWLDLAFWGAGLAFWKHDILRDRVDVSSNFFAQFDIDEALWRSERHPWNSRIHPDDLARHQQLVLTHRETGADSFECEYRFQTAKGWIWVLDRGRTVERGADGRPTQVAGTLLDISERKALEQELLRVAERERRRIGDDLHDGLGQELTGIALMLRGLESRMLVSNAGLKEDVATVIRQLNKTIENVRTLAHGLSPTGQFQGGLIPALRSLARDIERTRNVRVGVLTDDDAAVNEGTSDQIYRIAQEALTNAIRHGGATRISIELRDHGATRSLAVIDNGRGISTTQAEPDGMGLRLMAHRARLIGGEAKVARGSDGGTEVVVRWPRSSQFSGALMDSNQQQRSGS